jgi:hypothetical protein
MRVLLELRRGLFVELDESELTIPAAKIAQAKQEINAEIIRRYTA